MLHIKLVRSIIEPLQRGIGLLVIVNQGEYTEELTSERRRMWISAISRDDLLMIFSNAIGSAAGRGISFQEKLRKIGIDSTWTGSLPYHLRHSKQHEKDPEETAVRAVARSTNQGRIIPPVLTRKQ